MFRHQICDERWKRIQGLLPAQSGRPGRPSKDNRLMVNGMLWILKTGAPWRDLPERFGPWKSVFTRFSRWTKAGLWKKVFDEVSKDRDTESHMIDSTIVRAHQDASGARKKLDRTTQSAAHRVGRRRRSTPSSMHSAIRCG